MLIFSILVYYHGRAVHPVTHGYQSHWVPCIFVGACSRVIKHWVYNAWRLPFDASVEAPDEGGHNDYVDVDVDDANLN